MAGSVGSSSSSSSGGSTSRSASSESSRSGSSTAGANKSGNVGESPGSVSGQNESSKANSVADNTTKGPAVGATGAIADASNISAEAKSATASNPEADASVDAITRGLAASDPVAEKPAQAAEQTTAATNALKEGLGTSTLRSGMNAEAVGALQGALNEKLGLSLGTDGKFGPKTRDAVKSFQTQQGLKADGVVGKATREALLSGGPRTDTPTAGQPTPAGAQVGEEAKPAEAAATPRDALGYAALGEALGTKDLSPGVKEPKAVTALQGALNEALGKDMAVDGKFGRDTTAAVKEFQEKQGIKADGVLNEATRAALMGPKPATTREQLQDQEAARQQAATEKAPDMIFADRITPDEQNKVREIAKELQTQPNELMSVFGVETGGTFDPAQRPIGSPNGAVGLIQFTQTAVDAMNTRREKAGLESIDKDQLAGMSFTDQMDHVRDYLRDTFAERGVTGPVTREEIYTAVFAPSSVNRSDGANVYSQGSTAYKSNKSLDTNRNGHITREEITNRVDEWYDRGMAELNT